MTEDEIEALLDRRSAARAITGTAFGCHCLEPSRVVFAKGTSICTTCAGWRWDGKNTAGIVGDFRHITEQSIESWRTLSDNEHCMPVCLRRSGAGVYFVERNHKLACIGCGSHGSNGCEIHTLDHVIAALGVKMKVGKEQR